jgi:hypothetical protein
MCAAECENRTQTEKETDDNQRKANVFNDAWHGKWQWDEPCKQECRDDV